MFLLDTIALYASQLRLFWKARARIAHLRFLGHRSLFGLRRRFREHQIHTSTFLALSWLTIGQLLLALLIAGGMQSINPYLDNVYSQLGLTISQDTYGTFLGTVAATGALLIGLYYTATTAIGSAIYARVPNNIRDLLARERVGNVYMRRLALLTYLAVVLLAFRAAGLPPAKIAIPLFTVAAGIGVTAFVILGARAFNLFDPTTLSYDLFEQLRRDALRMRAGAYRATDPSFQQHAHRTARSALDTFATLAEITSNEPHLNGRPYLTLCQQMLLFTIHYEPEKKRIPTDSRWYAQRHIHPAWYQSGDTETSLAHSGATVLSPKAVSDARWIEKEVLPIAYHFINNNMPLRRFPVVNELLRYVDTYLNALAKEQGVQTAVKVLNELTASCDAHIFEPKKSGEQLESLERMAIVDVLASMPITIALAYLETVKSFDRATIRRSVDSINWNSPTGIYEVGLPSHALTRLEWLRPRIEFEIRSEGHQVSPNWYIEELVVLSVAENLTKTITALVVDMHALYDKWLASASSNGLSWINATILARETEYWSKVDYQWWRLQNRWTDLSSEQRIEGLPWPTVDFQQLDGDRRSRLKYLAQCKSSISMALSQVERPEEYPDFAGQFLHTSGEALFAAMCDNDVKTVDLLFADFFRSSLLQVDRIMGDASKWDRPDVAIKVALAPVLDLMDLSGYAILLAEFHDNPELARKVVGMWNWYLNLPLDAGTGTRVSFLAAAISTIDGGFQLAHRSLVRSGWKQRIFHRLSELERRSVTDGRGGVLSSRELVMHQSALVRVYAKDQLGTFHDGIDIFILRVLRKRSDSKELAFGALREQLGGELAREEKWFSEEVKGKQGDDKPAS